MSSRVVGEVRARLEYCRRASREGRPVFELSIGCDFGCECLAEVSLREGSPDLALAIKAVLCFNDSTLQGIAGWSGEVLEAGPERWVFEVRADLKSYGK